MDWFKHDTTSMDDPDIQEAEELLGDAGYSFFFKHWGTGFYHIGKKAAGRLLDGREWNEMPEVN